MLWSSFGPGVEGWFDTKIWDKTHDEQKAQGWTPFVLDTNGNGKRDAYTEPEQPDDPTKDKRMNGSFYGVSPAPDGSIWGTVQGMPGGLGRLVPGSNPTLTALTEYFEVPFNNPKASGSGFAPRGMDVDSKGVVWTVLSSGQLASFDRKLCKGKLNGPTATGQQCPEGWKFYAAPGPNFKGAAESASADSLYYDFVDQFDMLGLGRDVPIATGNESEAPAGARRRQHCSPCACRIRWGSSPKAWTAGSTIRTPAGRARRSTRRTRRARRSTSRAEKGRPASS